MGKPEYLPSTRNTLPDRKIFYGYTKLAIEQLLGWYDTLKGFRSASLRYFNAAGYDPSGKSPDSTIAREPRSRHHGGGVWDAGLAQGFRNRLPDPGRYGIRDYVHVTDLASAHVKALDYITRTTRVSR
jgi:UDP-glucose 4-epimerase